MEVSVNIITMPAFACASPRQAYDEVVLTTDGEADGFLAACVVFAAFTVDARRAAAAAAPGGKDK